VPIPFFSSLRRPLADCAAARFAPSRARRQDRLEDGDKRKEGREDTDGDCEREGDGVLVELGVFGIGLVLGELQQSP
jgi:hypothetical protein